MVNITFSVVFEFVVFFFSSPSRYASKNSGYQNYVSYTKMLETVNNDKFPEHNSQRRTPGMAPLSKPWESSGG